MEDEEQATCWSCGEDVLFDGEMCEECEEEDWQEQEYKRARDSANSVIDMINTYITGEDESFVETFSSVIEDRLASL